MRYRLKFFVVLIMVLLLSGCTGGKAGLIADQSRPGKDAKEGRLQDQGDGTCLDVKTGKFWQISKGKRVKSLEEAARLVSEMELAGERDWRLPALAELYELFLFIDLNGTGNCRMDFEGNYWSGDADKKGRVGAWELDGDCHPEREYVPKKAGYVRAVRP